jgi:hypothetical protein
MLIAHLFERISTPGANDNCSGVATILEIARTLNTLINRGELPRPKRTIRFLWGPEISGSSAYMYKYPELEDKLLAIMNYDMTGEDLDKTDSYLRMKMTPDSRPSYLNDLLANLLTFVDQTNITTQLGNNGIFNYRLVPFISNSDHATFISAGIPAMQFNHWPDNFYHSSEDRIIYSDPTELKRVGFMGATSFYYIANAGSQEAEDLAWECAANGEKWIAEVTRQSIRLLGDNPSSLYEQYKAANNKINGSFNRAKGTIESVLTLSSDETVKKLVSSFIQNLTKVRDANREQLKTAYERKCEKLNIKSNPIALTAEETELSLLIPKKKFKYFTQEYRSRNGQINQNIPQGSPRLAGLA